MNELRQHASMLRVATQDQHDAYVLSVQIMLHTACGWQYNMLHRAVRKPGAADTHLHKYSVNMTVNRYQNQVEVLVQKQHKFALFPHKHTHTQAHTQC